MKQESKSPKGYHTLNAIITVKDIGRAIDFYKAAFGAEESYRLKSPEGNVVHAEIRVGDTALMLSPEDWGGRSGETLGGSPVNFYLYVPSVDTAMERAKTAGAKETMAIADMFWGDRMGDVRDPFGITWSLATQVKELTPEQIEAGAKEFFQKSKKEAG